MPEPGSFEVVNGETVSDEQQLATLEAIFGHRFSPDWLSWKHREGPWGPSRCWVAVAEQGVGGLVYALPWAFRWGDQAISGVRFVDGGTVAWAERRGVFRGVVARELERWNDAHPGIAIATATPAAQPAHVKNGATALEPIEYTYGWARWRRAALRTGDSALETVRPATTPRVATAWDPASIRWRTDRRAAYHYEGAALANADDSNGIAYRVASVRGIRTLVPLLLWGSTASQRVLLGAVAGMTRSVAVLAPAGDGATTVPFTRVVRRGCSRVCVWAFLASSEPTQQSRTRAGWALAAADLEGVV